MRKKKVEEFQVEELVMRLCGKPFDETFYFHCLNLRRARK